jgi:hypothetical protein
MHGRHMPCRQPPNSSSFFRGGCSAHTSHRSFDGVLFVGSGLALFFPLTHTLETGDGVGVGRGGGKDTDGEGGGDDGTGSGSDSDVDSDVTIPAPGMSSFFVSA